MPNSEGKVCACRAANGRPIWNCALRLAEMKRPSGENTAMPSTRVPRNSGRVWKWMRIALGKMSANMWFSIICADMRTSASVCWWMLRWSPVTSSAPITCPYGSKMGAHEQVRILFASM